MPTEENSDIVAYEADSEEGPWHPIYGRWIMCAGAVRAEFSADMTLRKRFVKPATPPLTENGAALPVIMPA